MLPASSSAPELELSILKLSLAPRDHRPDCVLEKVLVRENEASKMDMCAKALGAASIPCGH